MTGWDDLTISACGGRGCACSGQGAHLRCVVIGTGASPQALRAFPRGILGKMKRRVFA